MVINPDEVHDFDSFKQVKIAHINFPFDDVNSQSAIVEIKMPKLGMQFFLTGDASEETFARIIESDKEFFKKEEKLTSLVMLPHHGSIENKSIWLFRLFQPDIIGISAGNGGQFTHPSKELIDWIQKQKANSSFWEKFNQVGLAESMITYQDKTNAFVCDNSQGKMPFVCTNLLGNIKIDEKGIVAQFSSIIEDNGCFYEVDYSGHKEGITCAENEVGHVKKHTATNYYFCVKTDLCYLAKKVEGP